MKTETDKIIKKIRNSIKENNKEKALNDKEIRTQYLRGKGFGAVGTITANKFRVMNTTGDVKFIINNDGNVGIGATNPSQTLTVEGNINATGNLNVTGCIVHSCGTGTCVTIGTCI